MSVINPYAELQAQIRVSEHDVLVDGIKTRYWEYGDPATPVDLVMIHGFRGDHHGLEPFVWQLGPQFHILIPDLPGFGDSEAFVGVSTIKSFSSWLLAFWTTLKLPSETIVLGHSFGSIVVSAALAEDLKVSQAVLVNPIATNALKGSRGLLTRVAVFYYWLSAFLPERMGFALLKNKMIVRIMSKTMAKTQNGQLLTWIHDQHDQYFSKFASRESVLEAFKVSVSHDVSEYAPDISVPILMIAADKDDITTIDKQRELVNLFPQAVLKEIPNVGHLVHYEAPELATMYVREFMDKSST